MYNVVIVIQKEQKMPSIIPAKDVSAMIFKTLQDSVRETLGPDATEDEIQQAERAVLEAFGAQMFTAKMG